MDQYFSRIKHFAGITELPSRIRFMLQDVIELRDNKVSHVTHHFSVVLQLHIIFHLLKSSNTGVKKVTLDH